MLVTLPYGSRRQCSCVELGLLESLWKNTMVRLIIFEKISKYRTSEGVTDPFKSSNFQTSFLKTFDKPIIIDHQKM